MFLSSFLIVYFEKKNWHKRLTMMVITIKSVSTSTSRTRTGQHQASQAHGLTGWSIRVAWPKELNIKVWRTDPQAQVYAMPVSYSSLSQVSAAGKRHTEQHLAICQNIKFSKNGVPVPDSCVYIWMGLQSHLRVHRREHGINTIAALVLTVLSDHWKSPYTYSAR